MILFKVYYKSVLLQFYNKSEQHNFKAVHSFLLTLLLHSNLSTIPNLQKR